MATDRMPWFKWWDGTASGMKFRMLAEEVKLPVACIVGAWAYLLEHASRAVDRGSIADVNMQLMAYTLQIPDCETVCNGMKRLQLIDETGRIAKWEDRQGNRERSEPSGSSTERVQRPRANKKEQQEANKHKAPPADPPADPPGGDSGNDETHVTPRNATKRPKKKNREEEDKEPKTLTPSSSGDDGVTPFDQFWDAYPRKVGKQDALKAWTKLKLDASLQDLLAAIAAQAEGADWRKDDGQFIPHPATWLRGGRWLDEVRPYVAPPLKLPAGWWETREGLAAAGKMLTPPLTPRPGEYPKDFAQRIREALGQADPVGITAQTAPAAQP